MKPEHFLLLHDLIKEGCNDRLIDWRKSLDVTYCEDKEISDVICFYFSHGFNSYIISHIPDEKAGPWEVKDIQYDKHIEAGDDEYSFDLTISGWNEWRENTNERGGQYLVRHIDSIEVDLIKA